MKFDVIVGNPPYQEKSNPSEKLWVKFGSFCIEHLLNDNGFICFITPNAWMKRPEGQRFVNLTNQFKKFNLFKVNSEASKFFGVGESIGYWFLQKTSNKTKTIVKTEKDEFQLFYEGKAIPKSKEDLLALDIGERLVSNDLPKIKTVAYKDMKNDLALEQMISRGDFSETKTKVFNTEVYYTPSKRYYMKSSSVRKTFKLVINLTSYFGSKKDKMSVYNPVYDHSIGIGINALGIPCSSYEEGENLKSYIFSKLYRFWMEFNRSSNFNLHVRDLPYLGKEKFWTDAELYTHFGLTDEEIAYVEANVK